MFPKTVVLVGPKVAVFDEIILLIAGESWVKENVPVPIRELMDTAIR
jgi:hypothetical protein